MLSRVADSLFWMSRYIERAENNARIADVNLQLLLDLENHARPRYRSSSGTRSSVRWKRTSFSLRFIKTPMARPRSISFVCNERIRTRFTPVSHAARENARTSARTNLERDVGAHQSPLIFSCKARPAKKMLRLSPYEFFSRIITGSHLVQGIADATMTHGEGWDFIRIGKSLERADNTSRILDVKYHLLLPSGERVGGNVDTIQWMSVLKSCSALEAYRKDLCRPGRALESRGVFDHASRISRAPSVLASTLSMPRSHRISGSPETHYANEAERLSGRLRYDLDFATIGDIFEYGLHEYLTLTQKRLAEISSALFEIYCASNEAVPA